jgi:two-component system LytT family response regulator
MSKPLRILIVDDEAPARRKLQRLLKDDPRVASVAEVPDGLAAVAALRKGGVDLVLLDVQMPGLSGFDVVETVGPAVMPPVVFVTAFDQHAVRAFEVQALDYLLKPVSRDTLDRALDRARAGTRDEPADSARLAALLADLQQQRPRFLQRLVVGERDRLRLVRIADVRFFQAAGNYVEVHTAEKIHLVRESLAALEDRLDPARFARIHRSVIVNVDRVSHLEPWGHGDYEVTMQDGTQLRLSRRYRERLLPDAHGS